MFFIILVANVGGAFSPLGDPPLFVGFLRGVDFLWPAQNFWLQTLIIAVIVLCLFAAVDTTLARREGPSVHRPGEPLRIRGTINIALLALVVGCILGAAMWRPGVAVDILG